MSTDKDDLELLKTQAITDYVLTDSGRILHRNTPDAPAGPRLYLAGCALGNAAWIGHDVSNETSEVIEELSASEPPLHNMDIPLVHLDEYLRLLSAERPIEDHHMGMTWVIPNSLHYEHPATLVMSGTPEGNNLMRRLDKERVPKAPAEMGFADTGDFWPPWCIAMHGDEIASVAITVGKGPVSAEIGVATMPAYRGRGYAAAVTAGWTRLPEHAGFTLFYSTSRENVSSQRVTQRLGLREIGVTLMIT